MEVLRSFFHRLTQKKGGDKWLYTTWVCFCWQNNGSFIQLNIFYTHFSSDFDSNLDKPKEGWGFPSQATNTWDIFEQMRQFYLFLMLYNFVLLKVWVFCWDRLNFVDSLRLFYWDNDTLVIFEYYLLLIHVCLTDIE